jgi:transposase
MKWEKIKGLSSEKFRRLTGVKKNTFENMVTFLKEAHAKKKARGGRPNKVTVEEMLLMMLEYLREYRTYYHIGQSYGVSESYSYKIIRWTEDTLIKSQLFSLPGRKSLLKSDVEYEVVLVDASETPIQRPKKNNDDITLARRKDTL